MYSKFEELRRRAERLIWSSPKSTGAILPIGTTKEPALFAAIKDCNFAVLTSMMDNLQEVAVPMIQDVLLWLVFRPTNGHDTLNRVWLRGAGIGGGETPGRPLKCKGVVVISGMEDQISLYLQHILDTLPPPKGFSRHEWPRLAPSAEDQPLARIEELSLGLLNANLDWVNQHVRGCATLERFSCLWNWAEEYVPQVPLDLPRLRKSLSHLRESLTHLTIDTSDYIWHRHSDLTILPLDSLQGFNALTYLKVDGLALWGDKWMKIPRLSTILPPSLVTLILKTEWDNRVENAFYQLIDDCPTFLPNLRKLDCSWNPVDEGLATDLGHKFEVAGIDVGVEWRSAETESEEDYESDYSLDAEDDAEDDFESEAEET
jgi:hypothetical protein